MLPTNLSSELLYSLAFARELAMHATPFFFSSADKIDAVASSSTSESRTQLVVSAEALNVEKLWDVQQHLIETLSVQHWTVQFSRMAAQGRLVAKADIALNLSDNQAVNAALEVVAQALQVELSVVQDAPVLSNPGLIVMDMDSTVIQIECIDEIAKLAGVGDKVSEVTELAMQGKLDFAQSLTSRVACLTNADESILKSVRARVPLMPGIENLVKTLKLNGWKVAIASGGFTYFADYLKERLGLDYAVSNQLEIVDAKLTGKVIGGIIDAQVKAQTVEGLAREYDIPLSQTIALGDGANDLVMMDKAALGVAYKAKPIVKEKAQTAIRFSGLDQLLDYLQ